MLQASRLGRTANLSKLAIRCCEMRSFVGGKRFIKTPSQALSREEENVKCQLVLPRGSIWCYTKANPRQLRSLTVRAAAVNGTGSGKSTRRFAVLLTGHATDKTTAKYGGYGQMFLDLLKDPGEDWDIYAVLEGQFPSEDELKNYDGFVLTGSRHDAHGDEEWILKLVEMLQKIHQEKQKLLGICFGHQVLGRALGGKTGRADAGWEMGLREIKLSDSLCSKPYAAGLPPVLRIFESHRDQVSQVPPEGELAGSSPRTSIEAFIVGDNVLAIQGHPEFNEEVVEDLIADREAAGVLTAQEAKEARESMKKGADREAWQRLCKTFLKGTFPLVGMHEVQAQEVA